MRMDWREVEFPVLLLLLGIAVLLAAARGHVAVSVGGIGQVAAFELAECVLGRGSLVRWRSRRRRRKVMRHEVLLLRQRRNSVLVFSAELALPGRITLRLGGDEGRVSLRSDARHEAVQLVVEHVAQRARRAPGRGRHSGCARPT